MIRRQAIRLCVVVVLSGTAVGAQVAPRPFPTPAQQQPPPSTRPTPPAPPPPTTATPPRPAPANDVPNEATLGVPIYPGAQFLASYDAGRGQRFYIFGVGSGYNEIVAFYRNVLKNRGSELFESPPTYQFDIGRFREETMAFPPSVTVKDYTFGGSPGYPNPKKGKPERFATLIQVVPNPPGNPQ